MAPDETTERIPEERSTAPQSPFDPRDVAIGGAILLVGLTITLGLPLLGTL